MTIGDAYVLSFMLSYEQNPEQDFTTPQSATVSIAGGPTQVFSTGPNGDGRAGYWKVWESFSLPFIATATSQGLSFSSFTDFDVGLDNVAVNAVPIPAALPLFAGGLGLMGWMARRRRGQTAHA